MENKHSVVACFKETGLDTNVDHGTLVRLKDITCVELTE